MQLVNQVVHSFYDYMIPIRDHVTKWMFINSIKSLQSHNSGAVWLFGELVLLMHVLPKASYETLVRERERERERGGGGVGGGWGIVQWMCFFWD